MSYLLSIDQGTTSSRAIVYNTAGAVVAAAQQEFGQKFPRPGWVEHDALEIWESVLSTCREAIRQAKIKPDELQAIGITNQRETVLVWDRATGNPVAPAIVWQDRRTAGFMENLKGVGYEEMIREKTGLILDGYFSASKIAWILESNPALRRRAEAGELAAGTVESWLVFRLTSGKRHITDVTNASRTMLMNLRGAQWDADLLSIFRIPAAMLPEIVPNADRLAEADAAFFGAPVPICGLIGDQQAALFGQLCTEPGMVKCTYGTGCFMLMALGEEPVQSKNRLLTTVAWKIGEAPMQYALEGSIFVGGAAIQWLRDGLGLIRQASEVDALASGVPDSGGVVLVPAFTGLGAPHWDSSARGTLLGITRGTTAAHVARATLDGIAFQIADLIGAMQADSGRQISTLRVDGGASASNLLMQIQANILNTRVERPENIETTALGAAFMAGLGSGLWDEISEIHRTRTVDRVFESELSDKERSDQLALWRKAIGHAGGWIA